MQKYCNTVNESIKKEGITTVIYVMPNGENSKTFDESIKIIKFLAQNNINRNDVVIALGGGVVGDITGFATGIYKRGTPFIQVPTTLMAMVDASIGGKTAINIDMGKNLVGVFHQPKFVFCDTDIIDNLPQDIFCEGITEVIKYGIIEKNNIITKLLENNVNIYDIITECIRIKAKYVECDEFDVGVRQKLNFGHTIAHAIEQFTNHSISHGKAVGIGLAYETLFAEKYFGLDNSISNTVIKTLQKYNIDYSLQNICVKKDINTLINFMSNDKKNNDSNITFILPKEIGNTDIYKIPVDTVCKILSEII